MTNDHSCSCFLYGAGFAHPLPLTKIVLKCLASMFGSHGLACREIVRSVVGPASFKPQGPSQLVRVLEGIGFGPRCLANAKLPKI